jgi:hypothetical protein
VPDKIPGKSTALLKLLFAKLTSENRLRSYWVKILNLHHQKTPMEGLSLALFSILAMVFNTVACVDILRLAAWTT